MTPEKIAKIETLFRENFERRGELGASLSIWENGREVISLAGGFADKKKTRAWTAKMPVLVWSCTKAAASACVLHALQREAIPLSIPVSDFWPKFKQGGKEHVTMAQALSHQAGLAALDRSVQALDHEAVAAALAAQVPNWPPGTGHGYHPRTFGPLLDEILRRVDGTSGRLVAIGKPISPFRSGWISGSACRPKSWTRSRRFTRPTQMPRRAAPSFTRRSIQRGR